MIDSAQDDAVSRWQDLMERWRQASHRLDKLVEKNSISAGPAQSALLSEEVQRAEAELVSLKTEMNDLISNAARERAVRADSLVFGSIEFASGIESDADEAGVPVPVRKIANT